MCYVNATAPIRDERSVNRQSFTADTLSEQDLITGLWSASEDREKTV